MILACPAWAAAELVSSLDPKLSALLAQIPYTSSLTVALCYRSAEFDGQRAGHGFLVPQKERRRMAACTFVDAKFAHRAPEDRILLRCFFGGAGDDAVLKESDESLVNMAREELRRILGLTAAPVFTSISRWPQAMAQYTVGPRSPLEGNRIPCRSHPRPPPGRQRLHRHRNPGLHSNGKASREKNHNNPVTTTMARQFSVGVFSR